MSKELEALKYIENFENKRFFNVKYDNGNQEHYEYQTIKDLFPKEFEIIETALKALEIIKKRFTIQFIKSDFLPNYYGIMQIGNNPIYIKTQEEFDLLKEELL